MDYFRLELAEETLVSFGNIPEGEVYPLRGNQFDLLDRDGDEIKHGFSEMARLQPGTYYVRVNYYPEHWGRENRPEYNVIVKTIPDHGDDIDTATAINIAGSYDGTGNVYQVVALTDLHSDEDVDVFKVTLERETEVVVEIHFGATILGTSISPINLDLLSESGSYVYPPVQGIAEFGMRPYRLEAGTHYFQVSAYYENLSFIPEGYRFALTENTPYFKWTQGCDALANEYDDPLYPCQWHLENDEDNPGEPGEDINIGDVWDTTKGEGVNVAVIDTNVDSWHEDLTDNWNDDLSWDYLSENQQLKDDVYHDT